MRRPAGFTLVELVLTISLMAIVATVSVGFISRSSQGMIDTAGRQQLAATGYVVNEQISRAVRDALPGSIRTTSDGLCIEYMPVLAATVYTDLQVGTAVTQMSVVPYATSGSVTGYVSVYPLTADNIYSQSDPGALTPDTATLSGGTSELTLTLGSSHTFPADSPERRVYLSAAPETICQDGGYLYRYRNYGFIANVANLKASLPTTAAGGRSVLAYPLQSNSMDIRYLPATLQRNGLVTIEFVLEHPQTAELQVIAQQIRIHNVP